MAKRIFATSLAGITLAACTTYGDPEASGTSEPPVAADDLCGAAGLQNYVGKPGDSDNRAALEAAAKAGFRWITPGSIITRDLRPDRLNVELDEDGIITRISCF